MPKFLDNGVLLNFKEYGEYLEAKAVINDLKNLNTATTDFIQPTEEKSSNKINLEA